MTQKEIMKRAGCKTPEELMAKYPTEEHFHAAFPDMAHEMKNGGAASGHPGQFWDGTKWVSSAGGGTYSNGVFYRNGGSYSQDGGPVYPIGGAGPIFQTGGMTHAMYPGTGQGTGMLQEYAAEHFQMGGMPFAMVAGPGTGTGFLQELAHEEDTRAGMMKSGGILHIKESKKGTFTAAASKHGMGVQEFASHVHAHPENYSPAMRKKANFARNAAHFKHEYGGVIDTDNDMMEYGGNPFHPLQRFMQGGGSNVPIGNAVNNSGGQRSDELDNSQPVVNNNTEQSTTTTANSNDAIQNSLTQQQMDQNVGFAYNPATDPNNPVNRPVMNTDQPQNSPSPDNSTSPDQQQPRRNRFSTWVGIGTNFLAGLGTAALGYENLRNARNDQRQGFNQGLTHGANNGPADMGDYNQHGDFRPNQNTPTAAGKFYPSMSRFGGRQMMQNGGILFHDTGTIYEHGGTYEVDDTELNRLKRLGYKYEMI